MQEQFSDYTLTNLSFFFFLCVFLFKLLRNQIQTFSINHYSHFLTHHLNETIIVLSIPSPLETNKIYIIIYFYVNFHKIILIFIFTVKIIIIFIYTYN